MGISSFFVTENYFVSDSFKGSLSIEVGDGIEKAANDFESEVAATMAAALGQN